MIPSGSFFLINLCVVGYTLTLILLIIYMIIYLVKPAIRGTEGLLLNDIQCGVDKRRDILGLEG